MGDRGMAASAPVPKSSRAAATIAAGSERKVAGSTGSGAALSGSHTGADKASANVRIGVTGVCSAPGGVNSAHG